VNTRARLCLKVVVCLSLFGGVQPGSSAGVTLVTHGFNGNVTDWVIPMCDKIAQYRTLPGTNVSIYQLSVTQPSPGVYSVSQTFLDGVNPLDSDSGEILLALDWSTLSSGGTPTTAIASATAGVLLATNFIPELNGHALAELPLHLVGHSRGGSVITELARVLGAQGVWVDQVTTLDPHPVSQLGDPPVTNYANILFADNYWQNLGDGLLVPNGQAVAGAYNRQLTNLNGGYSSSHSDVHLWYHGTIQLTTPASDTQATITSAERTNWWTSLEQAGTNSGFLYGLIGGGNRFSTLEPAGTGLGRIVDGMNKVWDLGAGVSTNRSRLPVDNGAWPNLLRLNLTSTNVLQVGQPLSAAFYYQFGSNGTGTAQLQLYLDADSNPYGTNQILIGSTPLTGTGTNNVNYTTVSPSPNPSVTPPGTYSLFARITAGTLSRYLYAPQKVTLTPSRQAPVLLSAYATNGVFQFTVSGYPGQTIVIQASQNLAQWIPLQTNTLTGTSLVIVDPASAMLPRRYYRAVLTP
jgi:hypothetical protein